jgi:hypothetical protein
MREEDGERNILRRNYDRRLLGYIGPGIVIFLIWHSDGMFFLYKF